MTIEEFLERWELILKLMPPITMKELTDAFREFDASGQVMRTGGTTE